MKPFFSIVVAFFFINIVLTLPLSFLKSTEVSFLSFILSILFSLIWGVLFLLNVVLLEQNDMNAGFKIMGLNMALKIGVSISCVALFFKLGLMKEPISFLIFVTYYFVYTMLIAVSTTKRMNKLEK